MSHSKIHQQIRSLAGKLPACNTYDLVQKTVKGQELLDGATFNAKVIANDGTYTIHEQKVNITEADKITPLADYVVYSFEQVALNHYQEMLQLANAHPNNWLAECTKYADTINKSIEA